MDRRLHDACLSILLLVCCSIVLAAAEINPQSGRFSSGSKVYIPSNTLSGATTFTIETWLKFDGLCTPSGIPASTQVVFHAGSGLYRLQPSSNFQDLFVGIFGADIREDLPGSDEATPQKLWEQRQGAIFLVAGQFKAGLVVHSRQDAQFWCKQEWHHVAWVLNQGVLRVHVDARGGWESIGVRVLCLMRLS